METSGFCSSGSAPHERALRALTVDAPLANAPLAEGSASMVINGRRYIEVQPVKPPHPLEGVCRECALGKAGMLKHCAVAVMGEAEKVFGGCCEERDVIYAEAA